MTAGRCADCGAITVKDHSGAWVLRHENGCPEKSLGDEGVTVSARRPEDDALDRLERGITEFVEPWEPEHYPQLRRLLPDIATVREALELDPEAYAEARALLSASPSDGGWGMKRARWHLALAAQALRNAPCERVAFLWQRDCKDRDDLPRGQWCLRCRELVRLEAMGFVQPERPSDREFREAMERGEAFEVVDGGGAK